MQEIERKFLVDVNKWSEKTSGSEIQQGYLSVDPERTVRVRIADDTAFLTIKGKSEGITRTELEYEIPKNEATVLMKMCVDFPVKKKRFKETIGGFIWEIDVFEGLNKGLVLAEIELEHENETFELPVWAEKEVSHDYRYFNSWLAKNPFLEW